ncbi:peptidase P60 [Salmonella enterica subsp. enterica serovar Choleraesuis]|nr:peptidase P60 [Salmonella enterica subsp. enterica serovar Choleraesuis]
MRQKIIDAIAAHAAAEYPRECCGLLVQKGRVQSYYPCENIHPKPTEDFKINPQNQIDASKIGHVVGIVHSHPDQTARPTETDLAYCDFHEVPWHILSWPERDFRTIYPRGELPLVGRPFVLGVYDCWGLIMSYFRQEHGIELHDYRVDYHWWEEGHNDNFYQDCWYECGFREFSGPPQPGDMVIMQVQASKWNHAGILLADNMLLHHLYGQLSARVPYGGYWAERTMSIVRYKDLI